jgi:hypothetical protein
MLTKDNEFMVRRGRKFSGVASTTTLLPLVQKNADKTYSAERMLVGNARRRLPNRCDLEQAFQSGAKVERNQIEMRGDWRYTV